MSDEDNNAPRLLLTVLFALWAMAFLYAFLAFALAEPEGSGFTRGMNRIKSFLGWQGIAGLLAFCVFGVSRNWPQGSSVRRIGWLPLGLAACLVAGILGMIGWAMLTKP